MNSSPFLNRQTFKLLEDYLMRAKKANYDDEFFTFVELYLRSWQNSKDFEDEEMNQYFEDTIIPLLLDIGQSSYLLFALIYIIKRFYLNLIKSLPALLLILKRNSPIDYDRTIMVLNDFSKCQIPFLKLNDEIVYFTSSQHTVMHLLASFNLHYKLVQLLDKHLTEKYLSEYQVEQIINALTLFIVNIPSTSDSLLIMVNHVISDFEAPSSKILTHHEKTYFSIYCFLLRYYFKDTQKLKSILVELSKKLNTKDEVNQFIQSFNEILFSGNPSNLDFSFFLDKILELIDKYPDVEAESLSNVISIMSFTSKYSKEFEKLLELFFHKQLFMKFSEILIPKLQITHIIQLLEHNEITTDFSNFVLKLCESRTLEFINVVPRVISSASFSNVLSLFNHQNFQRIIQQPSNSDIFTPIEHFITSLYNSIDLKNFASLIVEYNIKFKEPKLIEDFIYDNINSSEIPYYFFHNEWITITDFEAFCEFSDHNDLFLQILSKLQATDDLEKAILNIIANETNSQWINALFQIYINSRENDTKIAFDFLFLSLVFAIKFFKNSFDSLDQLQQDARLIQIDHGNIIKEIEKLITSDPSLILRIDYLGTFPDLIDDIDSACSFLTIQKDFEESSSLKLDSIKNKTIIFIFSNYLSIFSQLSSSSELVINESFEPLLKIDEFSIEELCTSFFVGIVLVNLKLQNQFVFRLEQLLKSESIDIPLEEYPLLYYRLHESDPNYIIPKLPNSSFLYQIVLMRIRALPRNIDNAKIVFSLIFSDKFPSHLITNELQNAIIDLFDIDTFQSVIQSVESEIEQKSTDQKNDYNLFSTTSNPYLVTMLNPYIIHRLKNDTTIPSDKRDSLLETLYDLKFTNKKCECSFLNTSFEIFLIDFLSKLTKWYISLFKFDQEIIISYDRDFEFTSMKSLLSHFFHFTIHNKYKEPPQIICFKLSNFPKSSFEFDDAITISDKYYLHSLVSQGGVYYRIKTKTGNNKFIFYSINNTSVVHDFNHDSIQYVIYTKESEAEEQFEYSSLFEMKKVTQLENNVPSQIISHYRSFSSLDIDWEKIINENNLDYFFQLFVIRYNNRSLFEFLCSKLDSPLFTALCDSFCYRINEIFSLPNTLNELRDLILKFLIHFPSQETLVELFHTCILENPKIFYYILSFLCDESYINVITINEMNSWLNFVSENVNDDSDSNILEFSSKFIFQICSKFSNCIFEAPISTVFSSSILLKLLILSKQENVINWISQYYEKDLLNYNVLSNKSLLSIIINFYYANHKELISNICNHLSPSVIIRICSLINTSVFYSLFENVLESENSVCQIKTDEIISIINRISFSYILKILQIQIRNKIIFNLNNILIRFIQYLKKLDDFNSFLDFVNQNRSYITGTEFPCTFFKFVFNISKEPILVLTPYFWKSVDTLSKFQRIDSKILLSFIFEQRIYLCQIPIQNLFQFVIGLSFIEPNSEGLNMINNYYQIDCNNKIQFKHIQNIITNIGIYYNLPSYVFFLNLLTDTSKKCKEVIYASLSRFLIENRLHQYSMDFECGFILFFTAISNSFDCNKLFEFLINLPENSSMLKTNDIYLTVVKTMNNIIESELIKMMKKIDNNSFNQMLKIILKLFKINTEFIKTFVTLQFDFLDQESINPQRLEDFSSFIAEFLKFSLFDQNTLLIDDQQTVIDAFLTCFQRTVKITVQNNYSLTVIDNFINMMISLSKSLSIREQFENGIKVKSQIVFPICLIQNQDQFIKLLRTIISLKTLIPVWNMENFEQFFEYMEKSKNYDEMMEKKLGILTLLARYNRNSAEKYNKEYYDDEIFEIAFKFVPKVEALKNEMEEKQLNNTKIYSLLDEMLDYLVPFCFEKNVSSE